MKKILFVCNANLQRSPTAEKIFKDKFETKSTGVSELARNPLTSQLLEWADIVFVMEDWQRKFISEKFPKLYLKKKIINLDIPDMYNYMDEELVRILKDKVKV
ncbi:MAG: phosphotyrosine protein phosphatase [Nanoarchaeota archaeon]|nr:phosphotyrosine protein phosphatase [Nanoarchaeota archaeon]